MAKEIISLTSEAQAKYDEIAFKIKNNLLTNTDFASMSPEDQELVKEVLFDLYSKEKINPFVALSGLEFGLVALAKLFFELVPHTPSATPTGLDNLYTQLRDIFSMHDLPVEGNTWQLQYLQKQVVDTVENRANYKTQKQEITG